MLKVIRKYFHYYRSGFILAPLFKMLEALFEIAIPIITAIIIDKGIVKKNYTLASKLTISLLIITIFAFCFSVIAQKMATIASQKVAFIMREKMFEKITKLPNSEYPDKGLLITNITNDSYQLQYGIAIMLRLSLRTPVIIIGAIIASLIINIKFSIVFIVLCPLFLLLIYLFTKKSKKKYENYQESLDKLVHISDDAFKGYRIIKSYNYEDKLEQKFSSINTKLKGKQTSITILSSSINTVLQLIVNSSLIIILVLAFKLEKTGIKPGEVSSFLMYLYQISIALVVLFFFIDVMMKSSASRSRIESLLNNNNLMKYGDIEEHKDCKNIFEIKNLNYKYKNKISNSLTDINLTLRKGEAICIIGETGSGKSTFANLLSRLEDPTDGTISLYGNDIKQYTNKYINSIISLNPQNSTLFNESIKFNISLNKNPCIEKIYHTLDIVKARDVVLQKENKLDYIINDKSSDFSGGQKQSLTIARTLLQESPILIFDNSFSAIDNMTTNSIIENITKLVKTDLLIFISQKINIAKKMKRILVFDNGKIVGDGMHDDLYNNCQIYKEICISQEIKNNE